MLLFVGLPLKESFYISSLNFFFGGLTGYDTIRNSIQQSQGKDFIEVYSFIEEC